MSNLELPSIQWFPGHMHKARQALRALGKLVDVYIEVLDARLPLSSANPLLAQHMGGKPRLRALVKADLADPRTTRQWEAYFAGGAAPVVALDSRKRGAVRSIPERCRRLFPPGRTRLLTAMVAGIPNAGKSTLVNTLAGRGAARTGDQPALTRQPQFIEIDAGFRLLDTPGLLWPKVENRDCGCRLAVTGAIRDTAMPHTEVAVYALTELARLYPERLTARYGAGVAAAGLEGLSAAGRRRGCLVKGGAVDLDRAAKAVLADIRDGRLGRISWEAPGSED